MLQITHRCTFPGHQHRLNGGINIHLWKYKWAMRNT